MRKRIFLFLNLWIFCSGALLGDERTAEDRNSPAASSSIRNDNIILMEEPEQIAVYRLETNDPVPASTVETFTLRLGPIEETAGVSRQWLQLQATKGNGECFRIWILTDRYPPNWSKEQPSIVRYLWQEDEGVAVEYRNQNNGKAVLPCLGADYYLFPQAAEADGSQDFFPKKTRYLGNPYRLVNREMQKSNFMPTNIQVLDLLPDVWIGVPINTRPKDDARRYDGSDYDYVRLSQEDFNEMIDAGMNCFRVDREQAEWLKRRNVYYWGVGGSDMPYPELLYRSNYLGPLLFLDEPAVCTRDFVIRPRLKEDREFRKKISPQSVFREFQTYYETALNQGNPAAFVKGLAARPDVLLGDMAFQQRNLYTWETIESTALYQLRTGKDAPPFAFVFEPPGHLGTLRTLPEMNMAYQCQIPVDSPKNFIDIIYGFLRGAARETGKTWGTSIYGSVDRADSFWFLTHAYDLGAQLFFFWNSHQLACVPYHECLALTRNLRAYIDGHPDRDLAKLQHAAEIAILLPTGFNLGHVHMGKGNLWGLGELNLERTNEKNVKYRAIMGNFFTEIERCIRLGVAYDLLWDLEGVQLSGYREIVRIREDGKVEVQMENQQTVFDGARAPSRPGGDSPQMAVDLSLAENQAPQDITARAFLTEGAAPVYYTPGPDRRGCYHNVKILWELYGPEEEDYRCLLDRTKDVVINKNGNQSTIGIQFKVEKPGRYRLRAAACDLAGRTAVVWKEFVINCS